MVSQTMSAVVEGQRVGGNGSGGYMEQKVKALEDKAWSIGESVASIKTTLEQMSSHLDTKAHLNALKARVNGLGLKLTTWGGSAIIATGGLVFDIVRYTTPPSGRPNIYVTVLPAATPARPTPASPEQKQ
jgi:hypothetical protein